MGRPEKLIHVYVYVHVITSVWPYVSNFQIVKGHVGNDRYSERGMQTINFSTKFKQIQTESINKAVSYSIYMYMYAKPRYSWYLHCTCTVHCIITEFKSKVTQICDYRVKSTWFWFPWFISRMYIYTVFSVGTV